MTRRRAALVAAWLTAAVPGAAGAALPPVLTDADVAPVSWGTRDVEARALAAQGRCADARALVDAAGPGPALVRAWLSDCARDPEGVIAATDGLAEALPAAAPLARALRAEALLTRTRAADALATLGCDDTPAARRLRARALRETGAHGPAALAYRRLVLSEVREDRALGLLGLARQLLEVADRGFDGTPAPAALAACALPAGESLPRDGAALESLVRGLPSPVPPAAWRAPHERSKTGGGILVEAMLLLRRLDVEHPNHWAAETGRQLAAERGAKAPTLAAAFETRTAEEHVLRAERLLEVHRNEESLRSLEPVAKAKMAPPLKCRALMARGKAHRKLRQWSKARDFLGDAAATCRAAKHELAPAAQFHWAAALERLSDERASAAAYAELRRRYPEHTLADDAGFFEVRHLLDDRKDWAAARTLAEQLVEKFPKGDMVGEAVFFVAAAAMAEDRWRDARAVLGLYDRLPAPVFTDHDAGRTEYWRARVAQKLKMPVAEVASGYESVFRAMPMGWYSLLAYGRLREIDAPRARAAVLESMASNPARADVPGGPGEDWTFAVPPAFDPAALESALLLARLGLALPAEEALAAAVRSESPETLWFTAWVLDRAGAYRYSHDILRRKLKTFRTFGATGPHGRIWRMAYPAPYRELVTQAETDTGVPAPFLWGIMREESGFNPGVESSANAVGLMQLILPTAKRMAELTKADEGPITRQALTDPRLSVSLGARYLAYVLDRVGGKAALPVLPAGYNAGEGALMRWLKARGHMPLDLFVEHMTFEEARWYTKRVVSSYATYRFLYAGGSRDVDPLPYFPLTLPR